MIDFLFQTIFFMNNFVENNYVIAIIIYFLFSLLFFSLSLPGGLIILLSSGFFFGTIFGFFINITSITIGSIIFIKLSKNLLKNIFKKYHSKYINKFSHYITDNNSYEYLILLRLLIGIPLAFQNILISFLNINFKKIFISTLIGFSPLMFLFSYTGNYAFNIFELRNISFKQIFSKDILLIFIIIIILILLKIFIKNK
tara:strand:+ start:1526 stop:2122 length:597 start_codon:yes stop_codon:yes gene_type:complete